MKTIFDQIGVLDPKFDDGPKADIYSGAGHIMGTCRMGTDPTTSVVDAECRSHDHRNLFIVGASVFPTCGTSNPTLTVAALALRAASTIVHQLNA
jgi:choline dehydrogenase-like flavoprotein